MSQPNLPFSDTARDAYSSSMEQGSYSQAQFDQLFTTDENGQALYSSNNSTALNNLDYNFDPSLATESSNHSTISTPNFPNYSFGQSSTYSTPGPSTPHPYPFELQQQYQSNSRPNPATYSSHQRPLPTRSQTNTNILCAAQPPQPYIRRRSLSQGDADRLAAANIVAANPTFFRLQAPRARPTASEDDSYEKKRGALYSKHGRSTSQGPGARGRQSRGDTPTSMPWSIPGNPLIGGMLPTPIGTPLSAIDTDASGYSIDVDGLSGHHVHHEAMAMNSVGVPGQCNYSNDPILRYMNEPEQLAKSMKIIEIGAMAVHDKIKLDPRLEQETGKSIHECILEKLEDVEKYLKEGGEDCEQVLKSCTTIREALARKIEDEEANKEFSSVEEEYGSSLDAPSKVYEEKGLYNSGVEDNDLMTMLMNDDESFQADTEEI